MASSSIALVNNPTGSTASADAAPGGGTSRKTDQSRIRTSEIPAPAMYAGREGHARRAAAAMARAMPAAEKKTP